MSTEAWRFARDLVIAIAPTVAGKVLDAAIARRAEVHPPPDAPPESFAAYVVARRNP